MTQRVSVYSGFTAKLKSGPRRQFGPRRSPERFWCFHRVIGPIQLYGNTDFHLGRSWVKTGYVAHGHFCCIHRYTRTRVASRPSRAIQLYSAIQRYTLYSYTSLYTIQPLQHPSGMYESPLSSGPFESSRLLAITRSPSASLRQIPNLLLVYSARRPP